MLKENKNKLQLFFAALVALTVFLLYAPTLRSGFIWDDVLWLLRPIQIGTHPYSFFFEKGMYYRPFIHLSFAFDFYNWHLNPVGYHVMNILVHIVNSVLVFLIIIKFFNVYKHDDSEGKISYLAQWAAFAGAMIFAVHPIHIESVAWISGRTDLFSSLFFMLAFLSFMDYESEGRPVAIFLSGIFFLFGLFCKENTVALVFVIGMYGILRKMQKKRIFIAILLLVSACIFYFFIRDGFFLIKGLTQTPGGKTAFFSGVESPVKIFFLGLGYYLEKLVCPLNLSLLPSFPVSLKYLIPVVISVIISIILWRKKYYPELFFLLWILLTLLPALPILYSKRAWPIAERYLYLPSVGFSALIVLLFSRLRNIKVLIIPVTIVFIFYTALAFDRIKSWKSDVTVWQDAVKKNPVSSIAHLNLGSALLHEGKKDKARNELLLALVQKDVSPHQISLIASLLGAIELDQKNYKTAEEYFIISINANRSNETAYYNLGLVYAKESTEIKNNDLLKQKYLKAAIYNFEYALKLSSTFILPKFNLGLAFLKLGEMEQAEKYFMMVIESDPQSEHAAKAARILKQMLTVDKKELLEKIQ